MAADRFQRLLGLLDAQGGDPVSVLRRVCELCVVQASVSGAALSVRSATGGTDHYGVTCSSGPLSAGLDEVFLTVGEGPIREAFDTGRAVLVPDLAADGARWPGFTAGALPLGVAAVFAFPLQVGVVRVGVLDLHRTSAGPLNHDHLADALVLAEIATQVILDDLGGTSPTQIASLSDIHAVVHQASGVVAAQLRLNMQEALLRIRGHSFANQLPLNLVARQIVAGELHLQAGGDKR